MKGLLRRPLAVASALFLILLFVTLRCGSTLALPLGIGTLLAALLTLGTGAFSSKGSRKRRGLFLCAGLLTAASLAFFSAYRTDRFGLHNKADAYDQTTGEAVLTVKQIEYSTGYSTTLLCDLRTFEGTEMNLSGRVRLPYAADPEIGDQIALTVTLSVLTPNGTSLADCYDYSQGIFFEAEGSEERYQLLTGGDIFPDSYLAKLKTTLRRQFYPYLSDDETGLVTALLIGDRSGLSPELSEQFRNLGISHTLAVSGLHLGILCGSLLWLFRKLRLPKRLHLPILLPLLLFYMLLVGSPSVYRAGGMMLLLLAAYHFGRRQDSLTSLFGTVTLICILSPESVLDVGLLLSFFATFGILLIAVPLNRRLASLPRLVRTPLSALTVTGAATLFTLPFSVWYFGEWALLSPLANLFLVPLLTALLYLIPLLLLLSPIAPLAAAPALLIRLLCGLIGLAGSFFGGSDLLLLPLNYPVIEVLALFTVAAVIPLCFFRKTRPLTLAAAALFLCLSGGYCTYHSYRLLQTSTVLPLTDGTNDCLLVSAGTRVLLIDNSEGGYAFLSDAVAAGETDPLVRVDALLLTHYHYRQISSVTRLLEQGHLEYLILPEPSSEDSNTAYLLAERAASAGCRVRWYSEEDSCIGYHDYEIELSLADREKHPLSAVTVRSAGGIFRYSADEAGDLLPNVLIGTHGRDNDTAVTDPRWNRLTTD